jgi:nitroreductase
MTRFLDIAKRRYSCRRYDPRPVESEKLDLILEAGRIAPSAVNLQPWHFFVIRDPDGLEKICRTYHRDWLGTAPCVIVICGDHNQSWKRRDGKDHCDIDVAITTDHMTLQATELGLATCWICNFDPLKVREVLDLPGHLEPAVLLPVGYPLDEVDPERHRAKRKAPSEFITFGL